MRRRGDVRENWGTKMRTDFENIEDGTRLMLHPNASNPLHNKPMLATFISGYFYCDESDPANGPDYYFRDVSMYNDGFTINEGTGA